MCAEVSKLHSMCPDEVFRDFFLRCENYFFCFGTLSNNYRSLAIIFWRSCQTCMVHEKNFRKRLFWEFSPRYFSTLLSKNNFGFPGKTYFTLSKLSSTSLQGEFEEKSLKTFPMLFFGLWAEKFPMFGWKLEVNLSELQYTCLENSLGGNKISLKRFYFPLFPDIKRNCIRHPAKN